MNPRIPKPECMMQKFQTLTKLIYVWFSTIYSIGMEHLKDNGT